MDRRSLQCLVLVGVFSGAAYGQCDPDCTGYAAEYKVPDPKYCSRYYICNGAGGASSEPVPCPPGETFNQLIQDCDFAHVCPTPPCAPKGCHLTCSYAGDRVADPFNCNVYYDCSSPLVAQTCNNINFQWYDHVNKVCGDDPSACCQTACDPYCDPAVAQVLDPLDCTKYYECENGEPIFPSIQCGPGQNFDARTGFCSSNAQCVFLCDTVDNCLTHFPCPDSGYFAKCKVCDPRYYFCPEAGLAGIEETCPGNLLFHPDPNYPYCVDPSQCPL